MFISLLLNLDTKLFKVSFQNCEDNEDVLLESFSLRYRALFFWPKRSLGIVLELD